MMCLCGTGFHVAPWQIRQGRGKYCSKKCMYTYRKRPSGLKYDLKVENKGWIQKGQRLSPETEFQLGELPHNFKGDAVGYAALHDWVRRHRGSPQMCEHCSGTKKVQWANKSGEYNRDLSDWLELCYWCHRKYDRKMWGRIKEVFEPTPKGAASGKRRIV